MKRNIIIPMLLIALLCALLLPGCKKPASTTPNSTPNIGLTPTTPTTATPTEPTEPNPFVTVYLLSGYTYDGAGEQKNLSFVYDDAGRILEVSAGEEVIVSRTYDEAGNCLSYRNVPAGIDQTYDAQGRILTDRTADGCITNTYDDAGRCIQIQRHSPESTLLSVTRYSYDDRGNLLSETLEQDGSVYSEILHTYDGEGLHLTATYYRNGQVSDEGPSYVWTYDAAGHLEMEKIFYGEEFFQGTLFYYIDEADQTLAYMQWDSSGRLSEYGHSFDKEGNITSYSEKGRDAERNSYSLRIDYEYDDFGNTVLQKRRDHTGEEVIYRWTYDETGTAMIGYSYTASGESYEYEWAYDTNGKMRKEQRTGDAPHVTIWEYDRQGKLLSAVRGGTETQELTCVYDEAGNLIRQNHTMDTITTVAGYTYTAVTVLPEVAARMMAQQMELLGVLMLFVPSAL